jgi:hypothetical protein
LARLDETSRHMVVEEVATLLANLHRHEAQDEQQRALPTTRSLAKAQGANPVCCSRRRRDHDMRGQV